MVEIDDRYTKMNDCEHPLSLNEYNSTSCPLEEWSSVLFCTGCVDIFLEQGLENTV